MKSRLFQFKFKFKLDSRPRLPSSGRRLGIDPSPKRRVRRAESESEGRGSESVIPQYNLAGQRPGPESLQLLRAGPRRIR